MVERDIWEVANQLEGYVGPTTPEPLASFLLREGAEASKLADRIEALVKERDEAQSLARGMDIAVQSAITERDTLAADKAELLAALEHARAFIMDEYRSDQAIALEGEVVSKEARPLFKRICDLLARHAAPAKGEV